MHTLVLNSTKYLSTFSIYYNTNFPCSAQLKLGNSNNAYHSKICCDKKLLHIFEIVTNDPISFINPILHNIKKVFVSLYAT